VASLTSTRCGSGRSQRSFDHNALTENSNQVGYSGLGEWPNWRNVPKRRHWPDVGPRSIRNKLGRSALCLNLRWRLLTALAKRILSPGTQDRPCSIFSPPLPQRRKAWRYRPHCERRPRTFQLASDRTTILYPVRAGEMARIGPTRFVPGMVSIANRFQILSPCAAIPQIRCLVHPALARPAPRRCCKDTAASNARSPSAGFRRLQKVCGFTDR
jgi:hypothetical protein